MFYPDSCGNGENDRILPNLWGWRLGAPFSVDHSRLGGKKRQNLPRPCRKWKKMDKTHTHTHIYIYFKHIMRIHDVHESGYNEYHYVAAINSYLGGWILNEACFFSRGYIFWIIHWNIKSCMFYWGYTTHWCCGRNVEVRGWRIFVHHFPDPHGKTKGLIESFGRYDHVTSSIF